MSSANVPHTIPGMYAPKELLTDQPLVWSAGTGRQVWRMFCASHAGDVAEVEAMLARDPALARGQCRYRQPLYFAVRAGQVGVSRVLLSHGANPIDSSFGERTLVMARERGYTELAQVLQHHLETVCNAWDDGNQMAAAIRAGDMAKVELLLAEDPARLHKGDVRSDQPIHWAVKTRNLAMVDALLAKGADINAKRFDGARCIHLFNGDYWFRGGRDAAGASASPKEVLEHLIAKGAKLDLSTIAHLGDVERAKSLLAKQPELANIASECKSYYLGSGSPLQNAASKGHMEMVQLLLEHGADPNLPEEGIAPRGRALYQAVFHGHEEIAKLLLEKGAEANQAVESSADALSIAMQNGQEEMVTLLCSHGAARAMDILAYYNDVRTAAAMFSANPALADDPNALANAAGNGNVAFIRLLLRYAPDLAARTFYAGSAEHPEVTEMLFAAGLDANFREWTGTAPLHAIASRGDVATAKLYLARGADLEARDVDHESRPLALAAKAGKSEMVRFLLEQGASRQHPDDPEWATPMAWAKRNGHAAVVKLLGD